MDAFVDILFILFGSVFLLVGIRNLIVGARSRHWPRAIGSEIALNWTAPATRVAKAYASGEQVPVFYNPDKPQQACLEPGISPVAYFGMALGSLFVVVGVLLIVCQYAQPAIGSVYSECMNDLTRITVDPELMGGRPCIRGMRVTVGTIVGLLASGHTREDVLRMYPYLEPDDISEALAYAAWRADEFEVPLAK